MSFLRHAGIYRSDDASAAGRERLCSLPALIGLDEFQPAIPWQVALQQSLPPLRRLRTILNNLTRRTMTFQRTVTTPLIRCLSPRVQSKMAPPPIFVVGRDRAAQEGQLDVNSDLIGGRLRGTQVSATASKRIFVAREAEESIPIYPMLIFPLGVWMQENRRCVFRHAEWRCSFWVATEL